MFGHGLKVWNKHFLPGANFSGLRSSLFTPVNLAYIYYFSAFSAIFLYNPNLVSLSLEISFFCMLIESLITIVSLFCEFMRALPGYFDGSRVEILPEFNGGCVNSSWNFLTEPLSV